MDRIQMVDVVAQHQRIKPEVDSAIEQVLASGQFIRGREVGEFEQQLADYLGVKHVITCGNGTDALLLALMSLGLKAGDEVICPAFTFISAAEMVAFLGLKPVFVDVDYDTFLMDMDAVEEAITQKTRAIIPVHLFGQGCDMQALMQIAKQHDLKIIEDNAQALGSLLTMSSGESRQLGTIGHIGTTSFFPTKNLACYGDGGAVFTNDDHLAERIKLLANHGMQPKYTHRLIGINSRLDTLQAAVLQVKLRHLDDFNQRKQTIAQQYCHHLQDIKEIVLPKQVSYCQHTFHQFTIKVLDDRRDALKAYLQDRNIATAVYYPSALTKQEAFQNHQAQRPTPISDKLAKEVISLPIHSELRAEQVEFICNTIRDFFH